MSSCKDPAQPFPSPGSAFIPPPVPGPHEFALRHLPRRMSKRDADDAIPDPRRSTYSGNTTPTPPAAANRVALSSPNGVVSHTRAPVPLSFLGSFVPRFIFSVLNMPRSVWRVLPFQDPSPVPAPPTAGDPPDACPHDLSSVSDPQLSLPSSSNHTNHRLSTQSVTSLTSSRPAPPSPAVSRRASGLSRTSSRPVSGMSSSAPSRPASGVLHTRPVSGGGSRPASSTATPTTTTTTPTAATSNFPHHTSDRLPLASPDDSTAAKPTPMPIHTTPTVATTPTLIRIRDYGFAFTDPQFTGQGPHVPRANRPAFLARRLAPSSGSTPASSSDSHDDDDDGDEDEDGRERMSTDAQRMWEHVDNGTNGWNGFKWGLGRAWGFESECDTGAEFPSRGDLDRNFGCEDESDDVDVEEDDEFTDYEVDGDTEGEPPLFPGLYRALYAFEPEGTAEMKLDEDQLVRVIGRGGGVGWAVVVKDGLKDTGLHALVPESYLELVRSGVDEEDA